jgi:hypothetical protein
MVGERARCKTITKNGTPCKAAPMASGFCFLHGNPNRASELGRIGGRQNRRERTPSGYAPPKLDGLGSALERLQWIFDESMAGSMRPAVANILMKVTDLQTRVWEKTRLEQQIAELQEQVTTLSSMINLRDFTSSISEGESDEDSSDSISEGESDEDSSER